MWDIKQGQELRGVLSTLLLHYILLEDIVLEAEGSVAEDPKDCSILHIYVWSSFILGFQSIGQKWFLPCSTCTFVLCLP